MKINNRYRFTGYGYEDLRQCQCLSCKEIHFCPDDERYKFCPWCGTELLKEFTKQNKRYYCIPWKQRFPYISFYVLKIVNQKLANDGFYAVNIEPYQKWQLSGQINWEDFVGNREKQEKWPEFPILFRGHINRLKKDQSNINIKAVITRWNGDTKELLLK